MRKLDRSPPHRSSFSRSLTRFPGCQPLQRRSLARLVCLKTQPYVNRNDRLVRCWSVSTIGQAHKRQNPCELPTACAESLWNLIQHNTTQFPVGRSRHGYGLRRGSPLAAVPPRCCRAGPLRGRQATYLAVPLAGIWASRWRSGVHATQRPAGPKTCGALCVRHINVRPLGGCANPLIPDPRPLHQLVIV
jgi:hypothetical protein